MAQPLDAPPSEASVPGAPAGGTSSTSGSTTRIGSFERCKAQCLARRDKSSAGRIDPRCQDLCRRINGAFPCYYTTSSCSGRCYLYRGSGNKSGGRNSPFVRYRVSHERVDDSRRYFDLSTLESDPTGGGDSNDPWDGSGTAGQPDVASDASASVVDPDHGVAVSSTSSTGEDGPSDGGSEGRDAQERSQQHQQQPPVWLRFEPFILHVACRSLPAAWHLARAARAGFKNVGVTAWTNDEGGGEGYGEGYGDASGSPGRPALSGSAAANNNNNNSAQRCSRYIVAVWGDEGLDMPLQSPDGNVDLTDLLGREYLASLVNDRHERNWDKIRRFEQALHRLAVDDDDRVTDADHEHFGADNGKAATGSVASAPKSFDVIGDVAIVNALPSAADPDERARIGNAILRKNRGIKIVALRTSNLLGVERAPGEQGLTVLAGPDRDPLITTHCESGVKCIVDLRHTFFTPRMAAERSRLCQQVTGADEHVLVLFSGVGMDALQIASRTPAASVTAVEINPRAVWCARKAHALLQRNRSTLRPGAADRVKIIEGDVLDVVPTLQRDYYHRVVCPRPKEGAMDGDLGDGTGGEAFLDVILPAMKQRGGVCHWYEFCSEPEFPECSRSRALLARVCQRHGVEPSVLRSVAVGSVAMRQLRVCIDFRIDPTHT